MNRDEIIKEAQGKLPNPNGVKSYEYRVPVFLGIDKVVSNEVYPSTNPVKIAIFRILTTIDGKKVWQFYGIE